MQLPPGDRKSYTNNGKKHESFINEDYKTPEVIFYNNTSKFKKPRVERCTTVILSTSMLCNFT
jgi:hypothetical protein